MEPKNYLMVNLQNNIVENTIYWNGDVNTWQPPEGYLMLVDAETFGEVWTLNEEETDYVLVTALGAGDIGFTWDGTKCITNQPKPENPPQPITEVMA